MKRLREKVRCLLSLVLTVSVIAGSGLSEFVTVRAAQINEGSTEFGVSEEAQNEQSVSESAWMTEPEGEECDITEKQTIFETAACTQENSFEEVEETSIIQETVSKTEPMETEIWELPDTEPSETQCCEESSSDEMAAIRFSLENVSVKDSDGNIISGELFVVKGTNNAVIFTVEVSEGYQLKYVGPDNANSTIVVSEGAADKQYVILPRDMENGYIWEECVRIIAVPTEDYTVSVYYEPSAGLDCVENVIITSGDVWNENSPKEVTVSNLYDTCLYIKIGETQGPEIWIPSVSFFYIDQGGLPAERMYHIRMTSIP